MYFRLQEGTVGWKDWPRSSLIKKKKKSTHLIATAVADSFLNDFFLQLDAKDLTLIGANHTAT